MLSKDYFDWHYKILTVFMLIPPKNYFLKIVYCLVVVPQLVLINILPILELTKLTDGGSKDFSSNILILGISALHCIGVNKMLGWFFIKHDYDILLKKIRKLSCNFSIFDCIDFGDMQSQSNPVEKYKSTKIQETEKLCRNLFGNFLFYLCLNLVVSYSFSLQNPTYEKWNPSFNRTSVYRDYVYSIWYPFDISISDGYYWIGFCYQIYAIFFLVGGLICVDFLYTNALIFLVAHAEIIDYAFGFVDKKLDAFHDLDEDFKLREKRIIKCIKETQKIYGCAKMLRESFSSQLLIQELLMIIVICCSLYRATSVVTWTEMTYLSTIGLVCSIDSFSISWFSQNFTLALTNMTHRVYELDWINYSTKLRKNLIFLMTRLQKPFYFTLGSWKDIDINVFLFIIKTSYSFYTLITQTDAKISTKPTFGEEF